MSATPWAVMIAAGLGAAGLLVLGALGMRLWLDVRALSREVDGAARALADASGELSRTVRQG